VSADTFKDSYMGIVQAFDKDPTAIQFLREDGEGGFRSGIYRMAREIDRLRAKCGEPAERDPSWEAEEDERIDAESDAELARIRGQHAQLEEK
jgi:hypothetical protein